MRRWVWSAVIGASVASVAAADVVRLHNGNVLRGEVVEETAAHVRIVVHGGVVTIPRRQVAEVVRERTHAPTDALPDISEAGLAPLLAAGKLQEAAERVAAVAVHDLERLETHAPRVAQLWLALGRREQRAGRFQAAAAAYERALSWWPLWDRTLERAWLDAAGADVRTRLLDAGDVTAARVRLAELRDVAPDDPVLAWLAGRAAEVAGDPVAAGGAFAEAVGGPTIGEALPALRERAAAAAAAGIPAGGPVDWNAVRTDAVGTVTVRGFAIQHRNEPAATRVARTLRWHLDRADRWLGPLIHRYAGADAIQVELQVEQELRRHGEPWASGRATTRFRDGRILDERIELLQDTPQLLSAAIPHELGHLVLSRAAGPTGQIPPGLNEGFACRFEPEFKRIWYRRLHATAGRDAFTTRALLTGRTYPPRDQVPLFYASGLVVVERLLARGTPAQFVSLCQGASEGDGVVALRRVYGCTPEDLDG